MEEYVSINKADEEFLRKYMPSFEASNMIADFYSVFGDNTRIRILSALSIAKMCVCDLCYTLKLNQSTVSHQLKILRDAKIVGCKRDGKLIVYYITNPFVNDVIVTGVDNYQKSYETRRIG